MPVSSNGGFQPDDAEKFAASLKQRSEAASQLEKDLLTEVPLLYGQPGSWGDIGLARIRRDEMRRRSGEKDPTPEPLRFERATAVLAVLLFLIVLFAK
jgi:hypothetical protein